MSRPKRHHFVPQFYLRRFSEGKPYITCFHKKSGRVIERAPIRGQCAIDNFYGWDELVEFNLGKVEARLAGLMREIDRTETLPARESVEWQELLVFIALQSSRTQLSGAESDELADYYFKLMHQYEAEEKGIDLSKLRIGSKFPAAMPMQCAVEAYPAMNQLDGVLLKNNSNVPFFASDNPVIFYNSRFSHLDYLGVIGLTSQGLQIFYALSPTLMICLFDPEAYRTPSNTGKRTVRESDVIQIALLHYMWAGEVLFTENARKARLLSEVSEVCEKFLPFERSVQRESERVDIDSDRVGALIHSYRAHAPIEVSFEFIRQDQGLVVTDSLIRGAGRNGAVRAAGRRYVFSGDVAPREQMKGRDVRTAIRQIGKVAAMA